MAKYVYVLLSRTQTKFARAIRTVAKQHYNHVSISTDIGFNKLYAFARPRHNAVLLGRLVEESLVRYTLGNDEAVPVMVYKIPVSDRHHAWIEKTLAEMAWNEKYMYNLFAVLSYPLLKGYSMADTYTCVEFVARLLQRGGILQGVRAAGLRPDDMLGLLKSYPHRKGDIRDFLPDVAASDDYFAPFSLSLVCDSTKALYRLIKRTCVNIIK